MKLLSFLVTISLNLLFLSLTIADESGENATADFKVDKVTETSANLSWTLDPSVSETHVMIWNTTSSIVNETITENYFNATGLTPCVTYMAQIDGIGLEQRVLNFTTWPTMDKGTLDIEAIPLSDVEIYFQFKVTNSTRSSCGNYVNRIDYRGKEIKGKVLTTTDSFVLLTGLEVFQFYKIEYDIFETKTQRSYQKKFITTDTLFRSYIILPAPKNVAYSKKNPRFVEISWTAVTPLKGNVEYYQIFYTNSTGDLYQINTTSASTSYQLSGLKPCTNYTIWVRGRVKVHEWVYNTTMSSPINVHTFAAVPLPITQANIFGLSSSELYVRITPIRQLPCEAIEYHVSALGGYQKFVYKTTSNSFSVNGMKPRTTYTVSVQRFDKNSKQISSEYKKSATTH